MRADLTGSNPTTAGLPYAGAAITGALADAGSLRYEPDPFGYAPARAAVRAHLTHAPAVEHIALSASTSESYAWLFKLLCDPGDAVAVPSPSYPLFDHLATLEGVRLAPYALAYDGAWHIDRDSLRRVVAEAAPRAIVIVTPNNPTGSFVSRDELTFLASLGLPVVSDEVFAEYGFEAAGAARATTIRETRDILAFAMGGLSKTAGLPQLKLAWTTITGPETLVHEATERLAILADAYLSPGAPVQLALPTLLAVSTPTRAAIADRVRRNYGTLRMRLARSAATPLHTEGGWSACVRLPQTASEDVWVAALLARGVVVQPGAFYDLPFEPAVVVSLLTAPATFDDGLALLAELADAGPVVSEL